MREKLSDMEGSDLPEYVMDVLAHTSDTEEGLEKLLSDLGCTEHELLIELLKTF